MTTDDIWSRRAFLYGAKQSALKNHTANMCIMCKAFTKGTTKMSNQPGAC